jgi:broad specificity phosphatase PhoE
VPQRDAVPPAPPRPRKPTEVVLVRHGQTEWSLSGRHTGSTDVPLDLTGREQARSLARRLAGYSFDLVLVSPLGRARETCSLAGFDASAVVMEQLREWDYGIYEGRTTAEIRQDRPGWLLFADGCPGGENADQVGRRADTVISRLAASPGVERALVFAHGHLLRVLSSRWLGLPARGGRLLALSPATISILGWEHESAVVQRWNT